MFFFLKPVYGSSQIRISFFTVSTGLILNVQYNTASSKINISIDFSCIEAVYIGTDTKQNHNAIN